MTATTFFKYARHIIAFMVVLGSFGFLFVLLYRKIPEDNKETIQLATGSVLAFLGVIGGYYFGSSKDKSDSDNATRQEITSVTSTKDPTDPVKDPKLQPL